MHERNSELHRHCRRRRPPSRSRYGEAHWRVQEGRKFSKLEERERGTCASDELEIHVQAHDDIQVQVLHDQILQKVW